MKVFFSHGKFSPYSFISNTRIQKCKLQKKEVTEVVNNIANNRMFIGPCIIVIVEELETNLMSLVIFITLNICSTCFGH